MSGWAIAGWWLLLAATLATTWAIRGYLHDRGDR